MGTLKASLFDDFHEIGVKNETWRMKMKGGGWLEEREKMSFEV
jgi:hypothetical protein